MLPAQSSQSPAGHQISWKPVRIGYLAGTIYCGSTLTSFVLNTHPQIFSLGEMGPAVPYERDDYACSCGVVITKCPFFRQVADRMSKWGRTFDLSNWKLRYRFSKNPFIERLIGKFLFNPRLEHVHDMLRASIPSYRQHMDERDRQIETFVRAALAVSGKQILLDATKIPDRISELRRIHGFDLRVVHIVRDPRGYCNSCKKRGQPIHVSARGWMKANRRVEAQLSVLPSDAWLRVNYEWLCSDPSRFSKLAEFLGAEPFEVRPGFRTVPHHIIGNEMRLASDSRAHIELDDKWKRELSPTECKAIAELTGSLAREYGYDT